MRSSLLRTALQGILGSNPAVGIGAAVVGVTGLTVGGVIGVTSVTRSACAAPAPGTVVAAPADERCDPPPSPDDTTTGSATDATDAAGAAMDRSEQGTTAAAERTGATEPASSGDAASIDESGSGGAVADGPIGVPSVVGDASATPAAVAAAAAAVTTTTAPQPFRISGTVSGLTPGNARRLRLRIDNPNSDAIRILDVRVTVGDLPGCPGSNLQVEGYRASAPGTARVIVPARSSATLEVQAALRSASGSQDACRNRTFPLSFTGTAEQWSGR